MYVCMDGWVYVCIYVCMYVCMYIYIYSTHTVCVFSSVVSVVSVSCVFEFHGVCASMYVCLIAAKRAREMVCFLLCLLLCAD